MILLTRLLSSCLLIQDTYRGAGSFGLHGVRGTEWWPLNPCLDQRGYRTSSGREPQGFRLQLKG